MYDNKYLFDLPNSKLKQSKESHIKFKEETKQCLLLILLD